MPDIFQIGADLDEIAKAVASAEDKMKLAEAAMALNQLASENKRLMDENDELRKKLAKKKALECRRGSYFVIGEDGEGIGPVCPKCYQESGLVYLLERVSGGAHCPVCKARYAGVKGSVEGKRQRLI